MLAIVRSVEQDSFLGQPLKTGVRANADSDALLRRWASAAVYLAGGSAGHKALGLLLKGQANLKAIASNQPPSGVQHNVVADLRPLGIKRAL